MGYNHVICLGIFRLRLKAHLVWFIFYWLTDGLCADGIFKIQKHFLTYYTYVMIYFKAMVFNQYIFYTNILIPPYKYKTIL